MPIPMHMSTVSRTVRRVLPLALPLTLACGGETLAPPLVGESVLYWDLHLNHHAVTLSTTAPYDTLTLAATPRNIRQAPLTDLPAPQWVSSDPEHVLVTPEGVLVAVAPTPEGTQVQVTATLTAGNLKHTDYVLVRVVADPAPPVLATFSVHPLLPDSAKVAAAREGETRIAHQLPIRATDMTGASMTDLLVSFRVAGADTDLRDGPSGLVRGNELVELNEITGVAVGRLPGLVNISAEATAFGVAKADTLPFRIGLPIMSRFVLRARTDGTPGSVLNERELRVGVGAAIWWQAGDADARTDADITFTDPTHVAAFPTSPMFTHDATAGVRYLCEIFDIILQPAGANDCAGSGNLMLRSAFSLVTEKAQLGFGVRVFSRPGTYEFHSTLQGFGGRIVVVDEREQP